MAAPAGSRLRLVCSNCTTLCEVSIPASATQKPVRYQVRCPNCKTVNDPQIARTTNGVAEVVGPNSSAKRKASPTVRDYASPLCAFRAHAPRSLAAQNGPPPKRSSPTPQPKQPRPPSNSEVTRKQQENGSAWAAGGGALSQFQRCCMVLVGSLECHGGALAANLIRSFKL